jgi:beta-fructofuranosidase
MSNKIDFELVEKNRELASQDTKFKPIYHLTAYSGLINDPVGLVYHKENYYIHYQWHPYSSKHKLKYWGQYITKDFVNYKVKKAPYISPENEYESTGAYSGSVYSEAKNTYVFYTGDNKNNNDRVESVIVKSFNKEDKKLLFSSKDNKINPTTGHFRDPFVMKKGKYYYCLLGAQSTDKKGFISMWKSSKLLSNWEEVGKLNVPNIVTDTYMIECPNVFCKKEQGFLFYCAQGLNTVPKHRVLFQTFTCYDEMSNTLENCSKPVEMDYGFDFYAPQLISKRNNLFFGWFGMPDSNDYYSNKFGWANALTLVRRLTLHKNGEIDIRPHDSIYKLVSKRNDSYQESISRASYIKINHNNSFDFKIKNDNNEYISFNIKSKNMTFDRSNQTYKNPDSYGNIKTIKLDKYKSIEIFIDHSFIEIFFNDSFISFSSRFFIDGDLKIETNSEIEVYDMKGLKIREK